MFLRPFAVSAVSAVAALALIGFVVEAQAAKAQKSGLVRCEEQDATESDGETEGGLGTIGKVTIHLGNDGNAAKIVVDRVAADSLPKIKTTFTTKNSDITHAIVKTEGRTEDGECLTASCIEEVETVKATNATGDSIEIRINDHSYVGHPGSSIIFRTGGKSASTADIGRMVGCEGQVRKPWSDVSESELLD